MLVSSSSSRLLLSRLVRGGPLGGGGGPSCRGAQCHAGGPPPAWATYVQGQSPEKRVREYFYYIDHQGMLFLDDARMKNFTSCFKEKKFLQFFFSRLRLNETARYPQFPFLSPCGRERNFVRCDDLPFVFTHLVELEAGEHLSYGHAGNTMTCPFLPSQLCMQVETGRVYHPAPERVGGVGLVRSKLAIQLSAHFLFEAGEDQPPTRIEWGGQQLQLTQSLVPVLRALQSVREHSLGVVSHTV